MAYVCVERGRGGLEGVLPEVHVKNTLVTLVGYLLCMDMKMKMNY